MPGRVNTTAGDSWPGFGSKTHVGAARRDYRAVMQGMRDGRIWVDRGGLVKSVDVRVVVVAPAAWRPRPHRDRAPCSGVQLQITVPAQDVPNWAQFMPVGQSGRSRPRRGRPAVRLARPRRLRRARRQGRAAVGTSGRDGVFTLSYDFGTLDEAFYVRKRGTDGNRSQPGHLGAAIDPEGPALDVRGAADPWIDL